MIHKQKNMAKYIIGGVYVKEVYRKKENCDKQKSFFYSDIYLPIANKKIGNGSVLYDKLYNM